MKPVLLVDTDCGVDDAAALHLALRSSAVSVAAVTTVFGNVPLEQAVFNAGLILDTCGANVPFYRGAAAPLCGQALSAAEVHGPDGLGGITAGLKTSPRAPEPGPAALALVRLAREHASRSPVTLVALGPLTNLALALRLDPDFPRRVARLYIMGGTSAARGNTTGSAEFNFMSDPEAAAVVLAAGFKEVWVLPWETAVEYPIPFGEWDELTASPAPLARFMAGSSAFTRRVLGSVFKAPGMIMADPLAMAAALNPAVVRASSSVFAAVDTGSSAGRGLLAIDWRHPAGSANIHIITAVHPDLLVEMCREAFNAPAGSR